MLIFLCYCKKTFANIKLDYKSCKAVFKKKNYILKNLSIFQVGKSNGILK